MIAQYDLVYFHALETSFVDEQRSPPAVAIIDWTSDTVRQLCIAIVHWVPFMIILRMDFLYWSPHSWHVNPFLQYLAWLVAYQTAFRTNKSCVIRLALHPGITRREFWSYSSLPVIDIQDLVSGLSHGMLVCVTLRTTSLSEVIEIIWPSLVRCHFQCAGIPDGRDVNTPILFWRIRAPYHRSGMTISCELSTSVWIKTRGTVIPRLIITKKYYFLLKVCLLYFSWISPFCPVAKWTFDEWTHKQIGHESTCDLWY